MSTRKLKVYVHTLLQPACVAGKKLKMKGSTRNLAGWPQHFCLSARSFVFPFSAAAQTQLRFSGSNNYSGRVLLLLNNKHEADKGRYTHREHEPQKKQFSRTPPFAFPFHVPGNAIASLDIFIYLLLFLRVFCYCQFFLFFSHSLFAGSSNRLVPTQTQSFAVNAQPLSQT